MIVVADAIDAEFGTNTAPGTDLLGDGSVLDLLSGTAFNDKAVATNISARTLMKDGATSTSAPGISAAVGGGSKSKKKRK